MNGLILFTLVILTVVFAALKITAQIAWSWWWVFSPIWGPLVLVGAIAIVLLIAAAIIVGFKDMGPPHTP